MSTPTSVKGLLLPLFQFSPESILSIIKYPLSSLLILAPNKPVLMRTGFGLSPPLMYA